MGKSDKNKPEEIPWDLIDRCILPVVFSHAFAIILATILNTLYISQVSSFTLFILFVICSVAGVIFYHNLKVTASGKSVVITSCDNKLGSQLAKVLDDLGFTVFAGFKRKNDESEKLKKSCSGRLHIVEFDIQSETQIQEAVLYVKNHLPHPAQGIWALVNSAESVWLGEVEWAPTSVFRASSEANVLSVIYVTQAFLPYIRRTKGRIINIVSLTGRIPSAVRAPYCAAKAALEAISNCLRLEMRRWGVDVVVVEPGENTTATALWFYDEKLVQKARKLWKAMSPEAREECGMNYFEFRLKAIEEFAKTADQDLGASLRSLTDAICRTFPMGRYTPVTKSEKIQAFVSDHLPRSVYDLIYS